ncbi:uncharacterized protein VTP21DRAFT_10061 [Calcarisporiella thermophila]|uniref:uncharacterized protein n=1 Tax=Calcarisporiella thermophila TaxID=911321 RepID=UPI003744AA8D
MLSTILSELTPLEYPAEMKMLQAWVLGTSGENAQESKARWIKRITKEMEMYTRPMESELPLYLVQSNTLDITRLALVVIGVKSNIDDVEQILNPVFASWKEVYCHHGTKQNSRADRTLALLLSILYSLENKFEISEIQYLKVNSVSTMQMLEYVQSNLLDENSAFLNTEPEYVEVWKGIFNKLLHLCVPNDDYFGLIFNSQQTCEKWLKLWEINSDPSYELFKFNVLYTIDAIFGCRAIKTREDCMSYLELLCNMDIRKPHIQLYKPWGDILGLFIQIKWQTVATFVKYAISHEDNKENREKMIHRVFSKCLDSMGDSTDMMTNSALQAFEAFLGLPGWDKTKEFAKCVDLGIEMVEESRSNSKQFPIVSAHFIDMVFQPSVLGDPAVCQPNGPLRKALQYIVELGSIKPYIVARCSSHLYRYWRENPHCMFGFCSEIIELLTFGPMRDDDEKRMNGALSVKLKGEQSKESKGQLRLWAATLICAEFVSGHMAESVVKRLLNALSLESVPSTRCYLELTLMRLLIKFPKTLDFLWRELNNFNQKAFIVITIMTILLCVRQHISSDEKPGYLKKALSHLMPWTISNQHMIRMVAIWAVYQFWRDGKRENILSTEDAESPHLHSVIQFFETNVDLIRFREKTELSYFHNGLDPIADFNLEFVFHYLPALFEVTKNERISWSQYKKRAFAKVDPTPSIIPFHDSTRPLPFKLTGEGVLDTDIETEDLGEDPEEPTEQADSKEEIQYQKKILPWEMMFESDLDLSRVSMEKVREPDLPAWLQQKKFEGYTLLGLEQTTSSQLLPKFVFPERCVLLLGKEREGIPAPLLQMLDETLEIPQYGLTRSLNVHVSAAITLYAYTASK